MLEFYNWGKYTAQQETIVLQLIDFAKTNITLACVQADKLRLNASLDDKMRKSLVAYK